MHLVSNFLSLLVTPKFNFFKRRVFEQGPYSLATDSHRTHRNQKELAQYGFVGFFQNLSCLLLVATATLPDAVTVLDPLESYLDDVWMFQKEQKAY